MSPGKKGGPSSIPGRSGGSRPSFSSFSESHLEKNAMDDAVSQKSLGQKASDSSQAQTGGSALGSSGKKPQPAKQRQARKVGSLKQELVSRPVQDIKAELTDFFDINRLLGIESEDSPEEKLKKKQMLQRWQKLTKTEQQVAQAKYQKKLQEKQEEEKRKQLEKEREEEAKKQTIAPPSSPQKGPSLHGQGSSKSQAQQRLQQQRQTIGTMGSPN